MSLSGLFPPSRCCLRLHDCNQGLVCRQVSAIPNAGKPKELLDNLRLERSSWTVSIRRWKTQKTHWIKCARDASYGDVAGESGGSSIFPRINVREVKQSRVVQAVTSRFRTPATKFIVKTSLAFLVLGVLTVLFPTEEGPTLQVALSLIATFYFIHYRLKSKIRALLYGAGAFIFSWLVGTFLMVSVIPPIPILKGPRSFEVLTSLITYVLLWVSSTYLK
ncbi:Pectin lyase-like superfamily protein isoform 1 [Hibiscus syriacus]|uniref:Pectin lyase-like superfamily protein isoform 1 n=1 Tax=Hibiscus syriacus TaxID=106335 RepID=A0A6A3ALY1_HIBSY|nr:Pectin lyase-like superfamily protein isoform 1 [Hibiscus syriacus]